MAARKYEQRQVMASDYFTTAESIAGRAPNGNFLTDLLERVDRDRLAQLAGLPVATVNELFAPPTQPDIRRLDIEMPGGFALRNVNNDEDATCAIRILQSRNLSPESLATLIASNPAPVHVQSAQSEVEEGGTTIKEMVPRFATRKKNKLSVKALYE